MSVARPFRTRPLAVEVPEGDGWPERRVVPKLPTVEKARACDHSTEHLRARRAREGAAVMRMVSVEGT